jgi:hypothetical protein
MKQTWGLKDWSRAKCWNKHRASQCYEGRVRTKQGWSVVCQKTTKDKEKARRSKGRQQWLGSPFHQGNDQEGVHMALLKGNGSRMSCGSKQLVGTNAILVLVKLGTQAMTIRHKDKTETKHSINITIGVRIVFHGRWQGCDQSERDETVSKSLIKWTRKFREAHGRVKGVSRHEGTRIRQDT